MFNSGLQIAGVIGAGRQPGVGRRHHRRLLSSIPGTTQHGEQVEPIYNASQSGGPGDWPEYAGVPCVGDRSPSYDPLLQGQVSASQGDVYFLSWDGNPSSLRSTHPLGVMVKTRGLAWNFPPGNQDIIYFIYTLYNVSSTNRPDVHPHPSAAMQDLLLQQAARRTRRPTGAGTFGVKSRTADTPQQRVHGLRGRPGRAAAAGRQLRHVQQPVQPGGDVSREVHAAHGNAFDPGIHAPPFLARPGFVGTKFFAARSWRRHGGGYGLAGLTDESRRVSRTHT